jgi:glucose/arabinose dehydrogenase
MPSRSQHRGPTNGRRTLAALAIVITALVAGPLLEASPATVTAEEPTTGPDSFMGKPRREARLETKAANLPTGFQDTVVFSGLTNPTAVRFAPNGRVFVAEKSGLIKVFDGLDDTTPDVFADLRTEVHNFWDRGLLGLAVDPQFPTRPYVYALYTRDAAIGGNAPRWGTAGATSDGCPTPPGSTTDGCVVSGRLVRLTASGNTSTAQKVLVDDWCQQYPSHSIGSLVFGADGALYASAGDGASFTFEDYGQGGGTLPDTTAPIVPRNPCGDPPGGVGGTMTPPTAEGGALRSRDLVTTGDPVGLSGTIIRIDPDTGAGLSTNPRAGDADPNARRIVAIGLRNPFRITTRPGTNEIWIGDVGHSVWEEIDRIVAPTSGVLDFGWPCYEGAPRQPGYESVGLALCQQLYASGAATSPYYAYDHAEKIVANESCPTGSSAITGLAFYAGGNYPSAYQGALFFADHSRNCIWALRAGSNGLPSTSPSSRETFVAGATNPVDLVIGPGGDLFYVNMGGGAIHRIRYTAANQPPSASFTATPASGSAPLTVSFDGRASSDPEGGTLSYSWDLSGNGSFGDATTPTASWTYPTPGTYTARLRVTDPQGASATTSRSISVSNDAPIPVIASPTGSYTWRVGESISFSGSATDPQDGAVAASRLSWSIILHHCPSNCHTHHIQDFVGVASGSFPAPDHEFPSHLEIRLTATDSTGTSASTSVLVHPRTVDLTFASQPSGIALTVAGQTSTAPFTRRVIVGSRVSLAAPETTTVGGTSYTFGSWSDGGARVHDITAGTTATTYTAAFTGGAVQGIVSMPGPATVFRTGVSMSSTSYPARVGWRKPDGFPVARYQLQRSIDGGSWSTIATTTATSANTTLARDRVYRFRVRALDASGTATAWGTAASYTPKGYAETNSRFSYGGSWSSSSHSSHWGGKTRYTKTKGRSVTFSFTGRAVAIVAPMGPTRGSATVYVDGAKVGTISLYRSSTAYRRVVFATRWSSVGAHTVRIVVNGTSGRPRIDIDGAMVLQ